MTKPRSTRAAAALDANAAAPASATARVAVDSRPTLGFGVPATRVRTAGELAAALNRANATPGPHLIEAMFR